MGNFHTDKWIIAQRKEYELKVMGNFHKDEWIMARLKEHYDEVCEIIDPARIVGVFVSGSQNYGLDTEDSDIDTKCLIVPSFEELVYNKKPTSTTHIRKNNENITITDIRLFFQTLRKQNINFVEILFTKYRILNPTYEKIWDKLCSYKEEIATYNPCATLKACLGMLDRNYKKLYERNSEKAEKIAEWGYDPKAFYNVLRIGWFILDYAESTKSYADCLEKRSISRDIGLKTAKTEQWTLHDILYITEYLYEAASKKGKDFIESYPKEENDGLSLAENVMDFANYAIMGTAIKLELA